MRVLHVLAALLVLLAHLPHVIGAQPRPFAAFLPLVAVQHASSNRLAIDLRAGAPDTALPLLQETGARWARAGDVDWSWVESQPGVYRWEALEAFEANVRRIRAAGPEPTAVLMRTPLWASSAAGRVCGAPRADAVAAFEQFAEAAAARYASGATAVHIWQIGNEVDFRPDQITDVLGSGCWATDQAPYYGGDHFGELLRRVAAAIRRGNPRAEILAAGLAYPWPDDEHTLGFVRGMLAAGAGASFDALSFTGYGTWGVNDKLVLKAAQLRTVLAEFGLADKPLVAAEVGATCIDANACPQNFENLQQAYAGRIYAEAVAWNIEAIAWFTLLVPGADPYGHSLVDVEGELIRARPALYALRNSAVLLRDARPVGPPTLPADDAPGAQVLSFATPRGMLYAVWDPRGEGATAWIPAPAGAHATCTDQLELPSPRSRDCSAEIHDGLLAVSTAASLYVEIVVP